MSDQRVGAALRAVRVRRGWRQSDVAQRAGVSHALVSLIERGHVGATSLDTLRRVAAALGIHIDVIARWRGGELDRLLNAGHAALAGAVAAAIKAYDWQVAPEVSFAVYGERGFIDLLAWHAPTRTLLVIEIKTELVDVHDLIGVADRKTRLAARIGAQRGWQPTVVATWIVFADGATNRRRVAANATLLRAAFPADGRSMHAWLRRPAGRIAALTFYADSSGRSTSGRYTSVRRVRVRPESAA